MDIKSKFKVGDIVRIHREWSHYKTFVDRIGGDPITPKTRFTVAGVRTIEIENTNPVLRVFVVDVQWFVKGKLHETCFSPCFLEKVGEDK